MLIVPTWSIFVRNINEPLAVLAFFERAVIIWPLSRLSKIFENGVLSFLELQVLVSVVHGNISDVPKVFLCQKVLVPCTICISWDHTVPLESNVSDELGEETV